MEKDLNENFGKDIPVVIFVEMHDSVLELRPIEDTDDYEEPYSPDVILLSDESEEEELELESHSEESVSNSQSSNDEASEQRSDESMNTETYSGSDSAANVRLRHARGIGHLHMRAASDQGSNPDSLYESNMTEQDGSGTAEEPGEVEDQDDEVSNDIYAEDIDDESEYDEDIVDDGILDDSAYPDA